MSREDRVRWDEKHAAAMRTGAPTDARAFLESIAPLLPDGGIALDLACGRGSGCVTLSRSGFVVVAVDVSLVALAEVRRVADGQGFGHAVHTVVADLDDGLPPGFGPFDLVLCVHFHAPSLWPTLRAELAPGGLLAIETLTTENLTLGLPSPGPRWLIRPGEILEAADGLEVILHEEAVIDGSHRARLVARRATGPEADALPV